MSDWFYGAQTDPSGPVPSDEIRRLLALGQITPGTLVWCPAENIGPTQLRDTAFAAEAGSTMQWHYERGGTRIGPVSSAEIGRLFAAREITRDTLVWSPEVGPAFVPLGTTALAPATKEPPALPASAVDNSLAWVLVAIPLVSELLEQAAGSHDRSLWGWPAATFVANVAVSLIDEKRVIRSGVADRSIRLGFWVWLVPVYLYQRARALKGPKLYVWAWLTSFAAAFVVSVGVGDVTSLVSGDTYWGTGVPTCDSRYEIGQVRKVFDGMGTVRAAGVVSTVVTNARELGASGNIRTCAARISATNAQAYSVIYTVESRDDQILTNIQIR